MAMGVPICTDMFGDDINLMLDGVAAEVAAAGFALPPVLSNERIPDDGLYSLKFPADNVSSPTKHVRFVMRASVQKAGVAFRAWFDELPATNNVIGLRMCDFANAEQVTFYIQSTGAISAYRGATLLGSSAIGVVVAGAWTHIEMMAEIDNATGAIEVRINEVPRLNLIAGVGGFSGDTQNTALNEVSQWQIGEFNDDERMQADWYVRDLVPWDDVVVGDNDIVDFVGDVVCTEGVETADTAQADWQKSTGVLGYPLIAELDPNDATYLFTATDGHKSDFELSPVPTNTADILAVVPFPRLMKTDAGSVLVAAQIVSDGDVTAADAIPVTTIETYWPFVHTKDPATGLPWTPEARNAALVRLEREAA